MCLEIINLSHVVVFVTKDSKNQHLYWQPIMPGFKSACIPPGVYQVLDQDHQFLCSFVCNSAGFRVLQGDSLHQLFLQTCQCHVAYPGISSHWDHWLLQFLDYFFVVGSKHVGLKVTREETVRPGCTSTCIGLGKYRITHSKGVFLLDSLPPESHPSTNPPVPSSLAIQKCNCPSLFASGGNYSEYFLRLLEFLVTELLCGPEPSPSSSHGIIGFEIANNSEVEYVVRNTSKSEKPCHEVIGPGKTSGRLLAGEYGIWIADELEATLFYNNAGFRVIPMKLRGSGGRFSVDTIDIRANNSADKARPQMTNRELWLLMFLDFTFVEFASRPAWKGDGGAATHVEIMNDDKSCDVVVKCMPGTRTQDDGGDGGTEIIRPGYASKCLSDGAYDVGDADGTSHFVLVRNASSYVFYPEPPSHIKVQKSRCSTACCLPAPAWQEWMRSFIGFLP